MKMRTVYAMLIALLMVMPRLAMGHELGFGGAAFDGHSQSDSYSVSNGGHTDWALFLHYDHDMKWEKNVDENLKLGLMPGMIHTYAHWTKGYNIDYQVCGAKYNGECREWGCKTVHTVKYRNIDSHMPSVYLKAYATLFDKYKAFAFAGPGAEFADDGTWVTFTYGGGLQYNFTKNLGLEATAYEIYSDVGGDYRRFDVAGLAFVLRW